MNDLSVIDHFTAVFGQYIDSGFGLLGSEVGFLTAVLIGIDVALAGLFWLLEGEDDILARFLRKVLYVGFFAFVLNNFSWLSKIVFTSFAGLGLKATGTGLTAEQFLQPGRLASVGVTAGQPLLDHVAALMGFVSFFENFLQIAILLLAWAVVVISFFILAIQLFVAIIEFKLTTLAGFVLVPFALWKGTAFLAERVLGNVISSGVKILVLAVITGIGTTLFGEFTTAAPGSPTLGTALTLILAALALLGLGIFGPGIAGGLVSGAPQLGAGSAVGTAAAATGLAMAGAQSAVGGAKALFQASGGAARSAASLAGGARMAYGLATATSGRNGLGAAMAGLGGVARAGMGVAASGISSAAGRAGGSMGEAFSAGEKSVFTATGGSLPGTGPMPSPRGGPPAWAQRLQRHQHLHAGLAAAHHVARQGDHGGAGATPNLSEHQP